MNAQNPIDPLGRAVLDALARVRGKDDPLGGMAQSILDGEVSPRDAANSEVYAEALTEVLRTDIPEALRRAAVDANSIAEQTRKLAEAERPPPR